MEDEDFFIASDLSFGTAYHAAESLFLTLQALPSIT